MCGRFALDYTSSILADWYGATSMPGLFTRYNIAPMTDILAILEASSQRVGTIMHWGFIPHWAKETDKLPVLNNARSETIATKPMFRSAYLKQRCIIPASGFYEWKPLQDGKHKQPYYISAMDGHPLSFAGIWDTFIQDDVVMQSCAIITTAGNDLMRPIHDRMPVMLPPEVFDVWLKPGELPVDVAENIFNHFATQQIQLWPVSTAVNKATNQGPNLIQPIDVVA